MWEKFGGRRSFVWSNIIFPTDMSIAIKSGGIPFIILGCPFNRV